MQDQTSPSYCLSLSAQNLLSPLLNGLYSADAGTEQKRKEKKRKEKKRKEKKRKEKKRKENTFRRQFNEKPSIVPGCPAMQSHVY